MKGITHMYTKLRLAFYGMLVIGAFLLSSLLSTPASAATLTSAAQAQISSSQSQEAIALAQSRRDYERGYRDGRITANRFCERREFPRHYDNSRHRESDYEHGFRDGFNFTLEHSRFCHRHR